MYCRIEEDKLKRVGRRSDVYETCSYRAYMGVDYRRGFWHRENEILRPVKRQVWTVTMRHSSRFEGRHGKASIYLVRISFYKIVDVYKQSMLDGRDFDFFSSYMVMDPVSAKFPDHLDSVIAKVRTRFAPVVAAVVEEFRGMHEHECFERYVRQKREVDARIKEMEEAERRMYEERRRMREEHESRLRAESEKKKERRGRLDKVVLEAARTVVRAAKKHFHPDTTEGDWKARNAKSRIAMEAVDEIIPVLEMYADGEYNIELGEEGLAREVHGKPKPCVMGMQVPDS